MIKLIVFSVITLSIVFRKWSFFVKVNNIIENYVVLFALVLSTYVDVFVFCFCC